MKRAGPALGITKVMPNAGPALFIERRYRVDGSEKASQ